jgi:hypothetical protein
MAEYQLKTPSLPGQTVDAGMIRRPIKSPISEFRDMLCARETVVTTMASAIAMTAVFPQSWLFTVPASMAYYAWASSRKFKLPFKITQEWGGIDYGSPKPGGGGFGKSAGMLGFGQVQDTGEELWIENGDARRHGFILGTTGSGKALPLDTPVLTPLGWVENGALKPGDEVCHPDGTVSRILSVHPQGRIPGVRLRFSDGRHADCSLDHLWHVRGGAKPGVETPDGVDVAAFEGAGRLMTAADIGILLGMHGEALDLQIPRARPHDGLPVDGINGWLSRSDARRAATLGFARLGYMPSVLGTPAQRSAFLRAWFEAAAPRVSILANGVRLHDLEMGDARILKQLAWSLGGTATTFLTDDVDRADLVLMIEGIGAVFDGADACRFVEEGLGIVAVDRLADDLEMSCIKTDREDGLYVMEGHVVTHNTELLLGIVSQTLMWSSGFLFIDGKGTTEFYARAWTLAKRFGREDDIRVLNFTDAGGDPDAPAGGPAIQSNTVNPFAKGDPGQLMNIVVSLMGDAGSGNDMWKNRAMSLVTAEMKALCELRDSGEILLNVQTIRDFLFLGKGFDKTMLKGRKVAKIEDVPEEAWDEMRTRAGLVELYLRAIKGEFSESTKLAMKGFFDTLPGFSIEKAMNGDPQDSKCNEQYGFLSMQLTKPLGSLADDYGHIFRTPLGEVDMMDIVLNRRILIVLLPALQKAKEEMENCGKIVVTLLKMLMGNTSGYMLQGSKQEIIDAKQTRAPSPYIVVLDEAGYYMVDGIDVMMAQARSLGFMIIVAGQDMAAMQKKSPQIAETAAANASILAVGKTVDGDKTVKFVQSIFGRAQVSVTSGYTTQKGMLGNRWVDRMDASFQEVDKVKVDELQNMMEGEFYILFNGTLVKAATFYIGGDFAGNFSVNKFIKVRGPTDRVPGLDQSVEIAFISSYVKATESLMSISKNGVPEDALRPMDDSVSACAVTANGLLWRAGEKASSPAKIKTAWIAGALWSGSRQTPQVRDAIDDLDDEIDPVTPIGRDGRDLDLDDDLLASSGSPRGRSGLASRPYTRIEDDDDLDFLDEPPGRKASSGLSRVARGATAHERHGGMIDMMLAEERARKQASNVTRIDEADRNRKQEEQREAVEAQKSLGQFFAFVAENSNRLAQVFAEEDIDGELGLEILKRSGSARPLPLQAIKDQAFFNATMGELEKIIATE